MKEMPGLRRVLLILSRKVRAMNCLEAKVPPAVVFLIVLALMKWSPFYGYRFQGAWATGLAIMCFLAGVGIGLWAVWQFLKTKTTVHPSHPERASHLVTDGLYKYSRNPMYLGLLLLLLSYGCHLGELIPLFFSGLFVLYMNRFQIRPEERALRKIFGESFENYRKRVRRWI